MRQNNKGHEKEIRKFLGGGVGLYMTPLEQKFQGGGGSNQKNHPWEGYGYFLESHILYNTAALRIHSCRCATLQIANFQIRLGVKFGLMLNIPCQYTHYCIVLLCEVYCVIV